MKKIIVICTLAFVSQFAFAQKTPPTAPPAPDAPAVAPPPPPPAAVGTPPPPPMKPVKVRTNKTEIVIGEKSLEPTNGKEDVNVNVGDKKIIIRKRIKMSDSTEPNIEIGDRKIIIKKRENVRIEKGNDKNETVFYVKDNGIGIAPEFHGKIFGLFDKLTNDSEGTGIGLALAKRIIEVHGGRIWIESQIDSGTTFYFTLPVSKT